MLHSLKCIVRNGFFYLPRGRSLKRLEQAVPLGELKDRLVTVFTEFYPSWIYENIYAVVLESLWLSLFLDSEDLGEELTQLFKFAEGAITGPTAAESVHVPDSLRTGSADLAQRIELCRRIEDLRRVRTEFEGRLSVIGEAALGGGRS